MYEYLFGMFIMGIVWAFFFMARKDLRKPMLWSGNFYMAIVLAGFAVYFFLSHDAMRSITPGYWEPRTLFDLGKKTGGLALEDVLFMFFAGGIAAALYEYLFRKRISNRPMRLFRRRYAFFFAVLGAFIIYKLLYLNDIYILIAFNFFGALAIIYQRNDLFLHSLAGGLLFLLTYSLMFIFFNEVFPNFIAQAYNLNLTSGKMFFSVPLEEYLFGLTFGMLWAPMYEYEHRYKDI